MSTPLGYFPCLCPAFYVELMSDYRFNRAMSMKFGFESEEEFKEKAKGKFSLVETGVVEQESSRLLLINVRFVIRSRPFPGLFTCLLTFLPSGCQRWTHAYRRLYAPFQLW